MSLREVVTVHTQNYHWVDPRTLGAQLPLWCGRDTNPEVTREVESLTAASTITFFHPTKKGWLTWYATPTEMSVYLRMANTPKRDAEAAIGAPNACCTVMGFRPSCLFARCFAASGTEGFLVSVAIFQNPCSTYQTRSYTANVAQDDTTSTGLGLVLKKHTKSFRTQLSLRSSTSNLFPTQITLVGAGVPS